MAEADEPGRLARILADVRASGGRMTTARRALVTALVAADGHVTADDLAEVVQRNHPDVHRSTIYRTLDALEQLGIVDHVHLGHGRAVYHLTDDRHQHLVCEACGHVTEAPDELFAALAAALRTEYGFVIRPNHFAVLGRCRACAAAPVSS
ncbi:MAG TPA: transcriptional repressor [Acidimicrobiales bacterium]|nr:transcriptional repressor [Acidimicrobiales bacterium]